MVAALVGGAAVLSAVAHGAFERNSPIFGRPLSRLPNTRRQVALTFDDGPSPLATRRVLEVLRAAGAPATFFLLGKHVDQWPELAREVAADGHELGNHGYHHRKLHLRGPAYVRRDLTMGADAIERATGSRPSFFRAPHGFRSPWVTGIARGLGQRTVGWTLGVWDSDRPGADVIARRAIAGTRPGSILLLHDGDGYDPAGDRSQTAEALPAIIQGLRSRGYELVRLPER
jgi:peptidoglycan/xylan/chitin deacetylase (PgdA/CDA1 family)